MAQDTRHNTSEWKFLQRSMGKHRVEHMRRTHTLMECYYELKLPDVLCGCSNSKPVSSGGVGVAFVALADTRGFDSVESSLCSFSRFFWRATLPFQHIQTTARKINFRCQHILNSIIMSVEIVCGGERLREEVEGYETKLSVCSGWLLNYWEANVNNTRSGAAAT